MLPSQISMHCYVRIHKGNEVSSCMKNLIQKHRTPLAISDWVLWQLPEKTQVDFMNLQLMRTYMAVE